VVRNGNSLVDQQFDGSYSFPKRLHTRRNVGRCVGDEEIGFHLFSQSLGSRAMIRVAALTSGQSDPATRFRVRQHIAPLRELGVEVREFVPRINKYTHIPGWPSGCSERYAAPLFAVWQAIKLATRVPGIVGSWRSELTWLQRPLLEPYSTLEWVLRRPLVFDVDDAIWLMRSWGQSQVAAVARRADVVLAGNQFLAEWFAQHARDVRVVPTAIDTERFVPKGDARPRNHVHFVVGWTGIGQNLPYLQDIESPIARFMGIFDDARLLVVADREPTFREIPPAKITFVRWSPEIEVVAIQEMDVGLMPLPDEDWSRGKCSFKMLQYMACGVPVVVSPVGMNKEVLGLGDVGIAASKESEWAEALEYLRCLDDRGRSYGLRGRAVVEERFSRRVITVRLAEILHELMT